MMLAAEIVLVVVSVLLVLVILLQSGRSAGLAGVIAGGANQTSNRRAKGMDSLLGKVTVVLAVLLFLLTMAIAAMYHYNIK